MLAQTEHSLPPDSKPDALALPPAMRKSLTWEQGAEMAQHVQVKDATGMQIYF